MKSFLMALVLFVPADAADAAIEIIRNNGFIAEKIGEVIAGNKSVEVK